jgi:hypothetical protein
VYDMKYLFVLLSVISLDMMSNCIITIPISFLNACAFSGLQLFALAHSVDDRYGKFSCSQLMYSVLRKLGVALSLLSV